VGYKDIGNTRSRGGFLTAKLGSLVEFAAQGNDGIEVFRDEGIDLLQWQHVNATSSAGYASSESRLSSMRSFF
jgi:hypothetical protein